MAITATGFDGTVSEAAWSRMSQNVGHTFVVEGQNDLVATGVSGTRAVQVSTGTMQGWGVRAVNDAAVTLTCASYGGLGTRWDIIHGLYDWSSNTVTLAVTTGSTSISASLSVFGGG